MDPLPPEALLSGFAPPIADIGEQLRGLVHAALPSVRERVRSGWGLIGYDVPVGRGWRYATFIAPEPIHIHLGFEVGAWMDDPDGLLEGAHLGLRKVRFLTFLPGEVPDPRAIAPLISEAARVAAMSRAERLARVLDGPAGRPQPGRAARALPPDLRDE